MSWLQIQYPAAFWALPVVLAVVLLLMLRSRSAMSKRGQKIAIILRFIWVVAFVFALAMPVWVRTEMQSDNSRVIILADESGSVASDADAVRIARQELAGYLKDRAKVIEIPFAGRTAAPGEAEAPDKDQTNIEAALRAADLQTLDSPAAHTIVITDGRATRGNETDAARRLALRGVPVHVVPAGKATPGAVRVVRMEPPVDARVGVPGGIRLTLSAGAPVAANVRLVRQNGEVVEQRGMTLEGRQTVILHFTPKEQGTETYKVEVVPRSANGGALPVIIEPLSLSVGGPPRILIADAFPEEIRALKDALAPLKVPVDVLHPEHWPATLEDYAAIVMSDFSGSELSPDQRNALKEYVEKTGGGLVFIGGPNVVPARWKKNELSEILPVTLNEKPSELIAKKPEVSVVFVLDRSGSMGQQLQVTGGQSISKLDLVKAAVQSSVAILPDNAQVAVVAFDDQPTVIVPPTSVSKREDIQKQVDGISMGGGTTMRPGIDEGLALLSKMKGDKYIVVLTDGICEHRGDVAYWAVASDDAKKQRVSWTSIAVGASADQMLLSQLASDAKGKYFFCDTGDKIPQVFIQQAQQIKRVAEKKDKAFKPRGGPAASWLKDVTPEQMPELSGHVRATPKQLIDTILLAENGEPLFAQWQYGLGRVIAFTADAKNAWGKEWITWNGYSSFWQQTIQSVMRPPPALQVKVRSAPGADNSGDAKWVFSITDAKGKPATGLKWEAKLVPIGGGGDASGTPIVIRSIGATEYAASAAVPEGDTRYMAFFTFSQTGQRPVQYMTRLTGVRSQESVETGPDMPALEALAEAGGGRMTTNLESLAESCAIPYQHQVTHFTPLWPLLVMLAILMWPLDLAVRKWM